MNFFDWMNMNMIIDIACIVFLGAVIWKFRKNKMSTLEMEKKVEMHRIAIMQLIEETQALEQEIISVAKNPQAARRKFKQKQ
tara:strand:- start:890 stop:1135 length:246 start_codon:yes stop_codon:yes gene_type:complete